MASRVKGITVEIGGDVTGLDKALGKVNKNISNTQSELKDVERLLKMDPTNTELLAQKQRLLSEAVEHTGDKLDALKEAEKQVQQQFERGDIGQEQYDRLKREIIQTESKLGGFKTAAEQAEKAVNSIEEESVVDVKRAADKASDSLDDAGDSADAFGDVLKAGAIIEGVKGIAGAISDLSEETTEYRKIMGTLEVSSDAAGYTAEQTADAYNQLYGVLGDEQSAATTVANLQAMGLSQNALMKLIDQTTGAWSMYGDSIPIDGLAEAINETTKAGQITGVLADVINWGSKEGETFGVKLKDNIEFTKLSAKQLKKLTEEEKANYEAQKELYEENEAYNKSVQEAGSAEDIFNIALKNCNSEAERANLIMQAMVDQGLAKTGEAWREQNADIIAANDAQNKYMESASRLAENTAPATTAIKDGMASIMETVAKILDQVDMDAITKGINEFFQIVTDGINWTVENKELILSLLSGVLAYMVTMKGMAIAKSITGVIQGVTTLTAAFPALGGAIGALANPVTLVVAAIVAAVTFIGLKGDWLKEKLEQFDKWLQGVFTKDWAETFGPVLGNILNTFFTNIKIIWDSIKRIFDGIIDFIRGVFTGNWGRAWEGIKDIFGGVFSGLVALAKEPINGVISLINGMISGVVSGINHVTNAIRGLSFKIPDWVPKFGGSSFGINIPTISAPQIPMLAKGGTVLSGTAIVGEAGPELLTVANGKTIVQPLTSNTANHHTNMGGVTINVYGSSGQDVNQLADVVMNRIQHEVGKAGAAL